MGKSKKEKLSVDWFLDRVKKGEFSPVYFFYGEEDFLVEEIVEAIIARAVEGSSKGFNLDVMDGGDVDGKDIVSLALSFPMMAERRVVVVKDFDRVSSKEAVESYCERPSPSTILILIAGEPDTRKKPYPAVKKNSVGGEFSRLYDNEIPSWIQKRVSAMRRRISPEAAELLHAYVGNSLREIANQLEKLFLAVGEQSTIEAGDVEAIVGVSKEFTVFELTKAVGEKNIPRATEILERMLDAGESPQFIIVMLTRHFSVLWKLSDLQTKNQSEYELAQAAQVNPFFLKEYLSHLRHYPVTAVEDALLALMRADKELKTTSTDPKLVMNVLLSEIARRAPSQAMVVLPTSGIS